MRPPLILTKLKAPRDFGSLLARPRLIDKLIQGQSHRLTLIHGSAGFGKTSLAVQWKDYLLSQSHRVAWLSLDPEDNDAERCISHMMAAINTAEPSIEVNTIALAEHESQQAIQYILTELVNKLETVSDDIYLILDDWHLIDNNTIQNALTFLIEYAPRHFHLVICSRVQPPLSLYTLRVKNQLFEVDIADLRFSEAELSAFFLDTYHLMLSKDEIHRLWKKTEGWAASLQLILLLSRSGRGLNSLSDNLGENHSIGEYLTENIIDSLSADTLDFLLKTAILGRLNGELCDHVTQRNDSQSMLESLYKQGMFIRPLDPELHWFQYHHLFAGFLRQRLQRQLPDAVNGLHRLASDWYADRKQTDEAVRHALAANDSERAITLVEEHAMWFVEHSFMGTLLNLVDKLPTEEIKTRAPLQMAIAWAHCLTHHQYEAQAALDCVIRLLAEKPNKTLSVEIAVLQATLHIYADRLDDVEALLTPCLEQKNNSTPWTLVIAHNVMTYVLLNTYRYEEAIQLQHRIKPFHRETQGPFSSIYGDCFSGIAMLSQCQLQAAKEHFSCALDKACKQGGEHSHMAYLAGALLGQLYYEHNQLDEAEKLLTRSRKLAVEGGVADFYIATYCYSARLESLSENFSDAYQILNEGQQIADKLNMPRLDFVIRAEMIKLFLLQGDTKSAQRFMQQWDETDITPLATPGIAEQMVEIRERARAQLLCQVSRCEQTIDMLTTILEETISNARHYSEVKVRTALAGALEHAGYPQKAEEVLLPALKTGLEQNLVRTFVDEGYLVMCVIKRLSKHKEQQGTPQMIIANSPKFRRWLLTLLAHFPEAHGDKTDEHTHAPMLMEPLKEKEIQILKMLERGLTNKEIGKNLNIGVNTVKWYLKAIYTKLGVTRRTQAVTEARRLDLI